MLPELIFLPLIMITRKIHLPHKARFIIKL
jgi:hypothetical protein